MPRSFCRTPCMHCSVHLQLSSESQCRFSFVRLGHAATVRPGALHAASSPWPAPRTHAWPIPGVGSDEPRRRWKLLRWLHLPWRPARARARSPRHPAPPNAPWLSACPCHASARPWHRRRGPASTERAPCRRRAAPPPFRRAHPQHQVPARLAPKWDRWTSTTMPKPLIPLHIPGTAVITRRRSPFTATASGCL